MTMRILAVEPDTAVAQHALRVYLADVAGRYHGREVTPQELEQAVREHPVGRLRAPYGVYLVALDDHDEPCGSVGLARIDEKVGEVQRLHVIESARRTGLGRRLMLAVETIAGGWGLTRLRLRHAWRSDGVSRALPVIGLHGVRAALRRAVLRHVVQQGSVNRSRRHVRRCPFAPAVPYRR